MRVFLADAEPDVRSALRLVLSRQAGVELVGEACSTHGLMEGVASLQPDLVLVDWELPGLPNANLVSALRGLADKPWIIALSVWPDAEPAALAAGVDAFVSKIDPPDRLLVAVQNLVAV